MVFSSPQVTNHPFIRYNKVMISQKWRRFLVLIFVLIAVGLLLWGYLPPERVTETLTLPPGELQVPTPTGFNPDILPLI